MQELGYAYERKVIPEVHRVTSPLKRWLLGTPQKAVQPEQLDFYLDEFVFRFNRRSPRFSRDATSIQQCLLQQPTPQIHMADKKRKALPQESSHQRPLNMNPPSISAP